MDTSEKVSAPRAPRDTPFHELPAGQWKVVAAVCDGPLSNRVAAEKLGLSEETVKRQLFLAFETLGCRTRTEMLAMYTKYILAGGAIERHPRVVELKRRVLDGIAKLAEAEQLLAAERDKVKFAEKCLERIQVVSVSRG